VGFHKPEVLQHGVIRETQFPGYAEPYRLGLAALEPDSMFSGERLHAVQARQEIDVPEFAPEFTVGNAFEADGLLLGDHFPDRTVFERFQFFRPDLAAFSFSARLPELWRAEQAADVVGSEGGNDSQHIRTIVARLVKDHNYPDTVEQSPKYFGSNYGVSMDLQERLTRQPRLGCIIEPDSTTCQPQRNFA
jgi:hypothetical protein